MFTHDGYWFVSQTVTDKTRMTAADFEAYNANYVGGDINGGLQNLRQLIARPVPRRVPYSTPDPRVFICSSATIANPRELASTAGTVYRQR